MSSIILPHKELLVPALGMSGEFMFEKYRLKSCGKKEIIYRDDFWRPNLITNIGLDRLAVGALNSYLRIGTGTSTPAYTDTALAAYVATSSSGASLSSVNNGAPNYETVTAFRYDFAAGVLNGTYTEIGLSWTSNNAANTLFSRALILDAGGNPTSISVIGPDEILQVTYRVTCYPMISDVSGSITIAGSGTHSYTARTFSATTVINPMNSTMFSSINNVVAYTGGLAPLAATAISGSASAMSGNIASYVTGTYSRGLSLNGSVGEGVLAGGIKTLQHDVMNSSLVPMLRTQVEFTPAIPKTSSQTFSLPCSFSWGRR